MHARGAVLPVSVRDPTEPALDAGLGCQVDADPLRLQRRVRIARTVEADDGEALSEGAHHAGPDQTAAPRHDDDTFGHGLNLSLNVVAFSCDGGRPAGS